MQNLRCFGYFWGFYFLVHTKALDTQRMFRSFAYANSYPIDLQVRFREFKSDIAACEFLVDGCECVHL